MIKYVYVLVDDETDYYLEQALISITSLKMYTPNAYVSLLIDDTTEETLISNRRNILELISELKVIKIESQFNKKARSRWLKTSMRQHIEGDFLFIDCDTVICEDLSDIENISVDLGAVLNRHLLIDDSPTARYIHGNDKTLGFNASQKSDKHFNSGVILCKDIPVCHSFFHEWHTLWIKGYTKKVVDQPSFNQTNQNFNSIIKEMDGIWNCQIQTGGIAFLEDAKIIHYFAMVKNNILYTLSDPRVLQKVRESYIIDDELKECLSHPRRNFYLHSQVITNKKNIDIIYSRSFRIFNLIYNWKCFQVFEKFLRILPGIKESE
jgi:hypothetical protein